MTREEFNKLKDESNEIKRQLEILDGNNPIEGKTRTRLKQRMWQIIEELEVSYEI